jgi:hypothetical protein
VGSFEFEDEALYIRAMPSELHVTCTALFTKTHFQHVLPMLTSRELDWDFLDFNTREVRPGHSASLNAWRHSNTRRVQHGMHQALGQLGQYTGSPYVHPRVSTRPVQSSASSL